MKHPFAPVVAQGSRILILGTFPSEGSAEGGGYYGARYADGRPRNDFWPLMADVFDTPWLARLHQDPGEADRRASVGLDPIASAWDVRYMWLKMHLVALWDVVASCERDGPSSDGELRDVRANDIPGLIEKLPDLRMIGFTGTKARDLFYRHVGEGIHYINHATKPYIDYGIGRFFPGHLGWVRFVCLPSPSRANTMPYAEKFIAYREAFEVLNDGT